ncbi:MAG: peptide ABC transporter substrate-binding protein [Bacteroidia bacterium]|nr:peptide ABC transporter substrate-binding protein [Bacteroidia bacterium]MCX7763711.1 peptide ABC transporter substrate-binding protein [Bacteroidia bacterium]MDW8057613.1 peptide ABC transporter substrate-binding protein [Bacteroidia bacterium]
MQKRWKALWGILLFSCTKQPTLPTDTLRIGLFSPYASLDPIYARDQVSVWFVQQLFMGLVTYDSALRIVPAAASRWEVSPDGRVYRFFLRHELTYTKHPQRHLRAQDVVYSWHRLANPRWASPGSYLFRDIIKGWREYQEGKAPSISGIRALSDTVLEVELQAPYAPFLHLLTMPYAAIVLPEVAESLGRDFAKQPVGLGPFYLLYEDKGRQVVFKRDTGKIRKIAFRWYANRLWAWEALLRGEIDAFEGTDRALDYLLQKDTSWKSKILRLSTPQMGTEYLGMRTTKGSPFENKALRRAMLALLWRLSLRDKLGMDCTPARSFIPPPLLDRIPTIDTSLTEKDLKLLRSAAPFTLYAAPSFRELCEYIQTALAQEGIPIQIQYLLGPSLREQITKGQIYFWKASWLADFPDGENFLILFESTQKAPVGPNTTAFAHSLMDSLIAESRQTSDPIQRRRLYTRAESLLLEEAPVIPLYHAHGIWFLSRRVRNFPQSPLPVWLPLKEVSLQAYEP